MSFKYFIILLIFCSFASAYPVHAKSNISAFAASSNEDFTQPEETEEKQEVLALLSNRPVPQLSFDNFMAYALQFSVRAGVPANTVILILLLPLLATIVAFFRHVIGLPSMGMLVPIALSITLLATGITAGLILLATIIVASIIARIILEHVRIMQLPKVSLSVFVVSIFVLATLTAGAQMGLMSIRQLSIFPILLLVLLSERIIALQFERTTRETFDITLVTLSLGIIGYFILSSELLRVVILLYPEVILLLIPINFMIGRYFGLRITEFIRFSSILHHGYKS